MSLPVNPDNGGNQAPSHVGVAARGLVSAAIAMPVASVFFPAMQELAAAALIALGLGPTLDRLLEKNREEIWQAKIHPAKANRSLALALLLLFFSAFIVAGIGAFFEAPTITADELSSRYQNQFSDLITHNFFVLVAGIIFAALYRANGLMLLLAFNAVHWGYQFSHYFVAGFNQGGFIALITLVLALTPHALTEVLAYILAGMGGTFISIALSKYSISSPQLTRVTRACVYLWVFGLLLLGLSAVLEISLAAPAFHNELTPQGLVPLATASEDRYFLPDS